MAMRRIRTRGHNASQLPTRQGDLQRGSRGFCGKGSMSIFVTCCLVVAILFFTSTDPGRFLRQKRPAPVLPEARERLPTSAGVLSNDTSDPALLAQSLSGTRLTDQASGGQQSATQATSAAHSSAASSNATADLLTMSADGAQAGGASAESAADSLAAVASGVAAAASKVHVAADRAAAAVAQQQGKQAQGAAQATEADSQLLAAGVAKQQALEELREQQSELAAGVAPHTLIDPRESELSGDFGLVEPDTADDKAVPQLPAADGRLEAKQLPLMMPTQPPSVFRAAAAEEQASEANMQPVTDSLMQRGQGQSFRTKGAQALAGGLETEVTGVLDDHSGDFTSSDQAQLDQQADRGASQSGGHASLGSGQSDLEKTAAEVVRARSQQKLVLPDAAATGAGSQATGAGRGSASAAAAGGTAMGLGTGMAGDPREAADNALQAEDAAAQADLLNAAGGMAAEDQSVLSDTAVGAAEGGLAAESKGGGWEAGQGDPEALVELQGEDAEAAVRDGSSAAAGRAAGADSLRTEAETEPLAEAKPRAGAGESFARDGSAAAANAAAAADIVLAEAAGVEVQAAEAAAEDSGTDASSVAAAAQSVLAEGAAAEGVDEAAALDTQAARRILAPRRQIWANPGIGPSMSL